MDFPYEPVEEAMELVKELEARCKDLPDPYFEDQVAMIRQALERFLRVD